jgi:NADP-dependent 3-hydroxy acid dehydrogenase YdfG
VVLAARRGDRLRVLATELGKGTLAVPTDVTDPDACDELVSRTLETFDSVDVLVANAGLGLYGPIAEGDPEDWRKMFEVNVLGVLNATRAVTRHMLDRGSGDVVFVSSLAGRRVPRADGAVYAATKHALTAIAEDLRVEVQARGNKGDLGRTRSRPNGVPEHFVSERRRILRAERILPTRSRRRRQGRALRRRAAPERQRQRDPHPSDGTTEVGSGYRQQATGLVAPHAFERET